MEHVNSEVFKQKIFNYEKEKEWKFLGDKPCIIDFYADRCAPCRMVGSILEELDEEYKDKINIYKINTDEEYDLAGAFGIVSIPTLLFVPQNEQPQMAVGAMSKQAFTQTIKEVLKVN